MNQHVKPGRSERTSEGLTLTDAQPLSGIPALWRLAALLSTVVMGVLALVAALYFGRSILLPVTAALIVGITLNPAIEFGAQFKIPAVVSAIVVVFVLTMIIALAVTFFAAPLADWIARAPEIGDAIRAKLRALEYPLSVLHELKSAIMPSSGAGPTVAVESNPAEIVSAILVVITPAVSQFVVFFGTLVFFLATSKTLQRKLVVSFVTREGRLRMLRIWNDIEGNLFDYLVVVTTI